jgi:hypothetical protein
MASVVQALSVVVQIISGNTQRGGITCASDRARRPGRPLADAASDLHCDLQPQFC